MTYYSFECSTNGNEIGWHPQCELSNRGNPNAPDGAYNVKPFEFPSFVPNVELELSSRAKWTDILSFTGLGHGIVLNKKVKGIMESHRLPPNAFYPIKIYSNKDIRQYYWLHFLNHDFWNWVNREASLLSLRSVLLSKRQEVLEQADLSLSREKFVELSKNRPKLTAYFWERLVLNSSFPNLDVFMTLSPCIHNIISQRLLDTLIEENITGFEVKEFNAVVYKAGDYD